MKVLSVLVFGTVLVVVAATGYPSRPDYYWRDYEGYIPRDAVSGGYDTHKRENYYIGQAVAFGGNVYGTIPTKIVAGEDVVYVPLYGSVKVEKTIKILCSSRSDAFKWMRTSKKTFSLDTAGKHLLQAGSWVRQTGNIDADYGAIYIGRRNDYIGSIGADRMLHYSDGFREVESQAFEVLTYE